MKMKTVYNKPCVEVIEVMCCNQLMAGSKTLNVGDYTPVSGKRAD